MRDLQNIAALCSVLPHGAGYCVYVVIIEGAQQKRKCTSKIALCVIVIVCDIN